jgi:dephospho-CoA kinase
VFDSDQAVHRLYAAGGRAVPPVLAAFPGTGSAGEGIDRARLAAAVLDDATALARLERIVHELVRAEQTSFLARQCRDRRKLVVLDVPLLFETGADRRVDRVAVVSAPADLQRQRALRRPGMSEAKLQAILDKQMANAEKRRRADFVIPGGHDRGACEAAVRAIVLAVRDLRPEAWPRAWWSGIEKGRA